MMFFIKFFVIIGKKDVCSKHGLLKSKFWYLIFINNGIPVTMHCVNILNLWSGIIVRIRIKRTLRFFFYTIFCIKYILVRYFRTLLFEFKYVIRFLIYSLCLCFSRIIDQCNLLTCLWINKTRFWLYALYQCNCNTAVINFYDIWRNQLILLFQKSK